MMTRRTTLLLTFAALLAPAAALAAAPPATPAPDASTYAALQARIIEVSRQVTPSVVHIEAIVRHNDRRRQVTGSGLIVRPDGLILTNEHVVEKAEKVTVLVPGQKRRHPARVLGTDKQTDIGVLRIETGAPLPAAEIGESRELEVGQWVLAVGNPYGLEGTVSFGIVSAMGRNLQVPHLLNDFIQTDAMIDRGSSGGPLVDLDGRVVGINSRGQGRGIGFTIPIDTALDVLAQIEEGRVERGYLGVTVQPLDRELAAYLGLDQATGVVVNGVAEGSPAARAGLEPGDVLTQVGATALEAEKEEDLRAFQRQIAALEPGTSVDLRLLRDGRERKKAAKIGVQPKVVPDEAESEAGFHVQEITQHLFRVERLATREGAYVSFVERGSPAAEAGLRRGDVVEQIESEGVGDLDDFRSAIRSAQVRSRFLLTVRRGDDRRLVLVKRRAGEEEPPDEDAAAAASHESND